MERLIILAGRPNKSVAPTKYFFKAPQVGRFIPLVGVIRRPVESPLYTTLHTIVEQCFICAIDQLALHIL